MDCQTVQALLLDDQLENLSADERNEIEEHLEQCPTCKNEVSNLNLKQNNTARSRKPMITWILFGVVSLIFVMIVITNQAEPVEKGIGEDLNMSATSNDIKVTITDLIADDYQTVIYYQIEDLSEGKYYRIDLKEILLDSKTYLHFYENLINAKNQENTYDGKLIADPLNIEEGIIEVQLTRLRLTEDEDVRINVNEDEAIFVEGKWDFEIPVTRQTAIIKDLAVEKELAGLSFVFDQLIMAPTGTSLSYQYATDGIRGQLVSIDFSSMSSHDRVYQQDYFFGNTWGDPSNRVDFESIYWDRPDHVWIYFDNYRIDVNDQRKFGIDQTLESQTFDFLGTTLTVDLIEEQETTTVEITGETEADRPYEGINYRLIDEQGDDVGVQIQVDYGYYLVDRIGEIYNHDQLEELEGLEESRVFALTTQFLLDSEVETDQPIFLQIVDYSKTIFVDETIRLDLD